MRNCFEESKCLASLAVFRELYNEKKDIYDIISEFLKEIISSKGKYQFTVTEITQLVNETYDFRIPEAVIRTSLGRLKKSFKKSSGLFTIIDKSFFSVSGKLSKTHSTIQHNNELIIKNLFRFIENEKKVSISEEDKEKIVNSFCAFIIDESTSHKYSEYISAFIIKSKIDAQFTHQLNTIKEGVVLYTGIIYDSNLADIGSWNNELTIYLETEILFHFVGYNGLLYTTLFDDFFTLVKEINIKSRIKNGKKLIHLKYFYDVREEIERFFKKAESIVSGKEKANPSKTAMTSIIDGCKTPADVIEKKTKFFELLRRSKIFEDDYDSYYTEDNHKYNIEDQKLIKQLYSETNIENVSDYLKYLNFINIHRKGISNKKFENVGFILLSGTSNTLQLAWNYILKLNGDIPLATNLSFLTNKLWFKLNKGFGKGDYPKTFDIVTKAQIVLSTQLNESVANKYEEFQSKYKNGEINKQQAITLIVELRKQAKKPEDISEYDVEDVLKSIEERSIEQYLQEEELFKNKAQIQEEENIKLKENLKIKEIEVRGMKAELNTFHEIKRKKKERKAKIFRLLKNTFGIIIFLIIILGLCYLCFNNSKVLVKITAILGVIGTILALLGYFGIKFKKILKYFKKS